MRLSHFNKYHHYNYKRLYRKCRGLGGRVKFAFYVSTVPSCAGELEVTTELTYKHYLTGRRTPVGGRGRTLVPTSWCSRECLARPLRPRLEPRGRCRDEGRKRGSEPATPFAGAAPEASPPGSAWAAVLLTGHSSTWKQHALA